MELTGTQFPDLVASITAVNLDPERVQEWHPDLDDAHLDELTSSMIKRGYDGPPIVVFAREDGVTQAVTGSHRLAAARWLNLDVPAVWLNDLLAPAGVTIEQLIDGRRPEGREYRDAMIEAVGQDLTEHVTVELVDFFGLDAS